MNVLEDASPTEVFRITSHINLKNGIAAGEINSYLRIGLQANQPLSECSITYTDTQEAPCTYQFTKERGLHEKKCNGISSVGDAEESKCQFDIFLKDSRKISQEFNF